MNITGSHSIKISEESFNLIRGMQRTRENYGDVVARLIRVAQTLRLASEDWQREIEPYASERRAKGGE